MIAIVKQRSPNCWDIVLPTGYASHSATRQVWVNQRETWARGFFAFGEKGRGEQYRGNINIVPRGHMLCWLFS